MNLLRQGLLAFVLGLGLVTSAWAADTITVYQNPDCGCCHGWVEHMRAKGFTVKEVPTRDMASVKQRLGVPMQLASCHTAVIDASGQIIEGHVPASVVRKLLASADTRGVAAPGMPTNAPGMGKLDGTLVTVNFKGQAFSRD